MATQPTFLKMVELGLFNIEVTFLYVQGAPHTNAWRHISELAMAGARAGTYAPATLATKARDICVRGSKGVNPIDSAGMTIDGPLAYRRVINV